MDSVNFIKKRKMYLIVSNMNLYYKIFALYIYICLLISIEINKP